MAFNFLIRFKLINPRSPKHIQKKAMLLFYEQNNISSIKEIFINQFEFAVRTYF